MAVPVRSTVMSVQVRKRVLSAPRFIASRSNGLSPGFCLPQSAQGAAATGSASARTSMESGNAMAARRADAPDLRFPALADNLSVPPSWQSSRIHYTLQTVTWRSFWRKKYIAGKTSRDQKPPQMPLKLAYVPQFIMANINKYSPELIVGQHILQILVVQSHCLHFL